MEHPRVEQLRFARSELLRGLEGVSADEGGRRLLPMNSIGWTVGHLAWQEQRYWLQRAQGRSVVPQLDGQVGYGRPASTPSLDEMLAVWGAVTAAADPWLDGVTTAMLVPPLVVDGRPQPYSFGSMLLRTTYHYWFHIGEIQAIRQLLGHSRLPDFVGNIDDEAPYRPELDT